MRSKIPMGVALAALTGDPEAAAAAIETINRKAGPAINRAAGRRRSRPLSFYRLEVRRPTAETCPRRHKPRKRDRVCQVCGTTIPKAS